MKTKKILLLITSYYLLITVLSGCAGVSTRESIPSYSVNGTTYYSLIYLCETKGVNWQYDTFTRTVSLNNAEHKVSLMVDETLFLVDGISKRLDQPVDIYQGTIVVSAKFKESYFDVLFKQERVSAAEALSFAKIKSIVIDPGHGGTDPGAISASGLREKDVNLDIAKRLNAILKNQGVKVIMTRSSDVFIPLERRAQIANDANADLFISIHANANRVKSLNGFEVYHVSSGSNDYRRAYDSADCAVLDLEEAYFANDSKTLKAILWDMLYTSNRAESINLSSNICEAMDNGLGLRIIGVKNAGFKVLCQTHMPAILVEVGYLSNRSEAGKLENSYYRQKIAQSIAKGISNYDRELGGVRFTKR